MAERSRLAASTAAVGAATALSRVAGLIRDVLAAALLGAGGAMSAFQIAFNVPNLIRSIVADNAISAAFLPVFVELREQGREQEAWRAAGAVLWLAAIGLGLLSVLAVLGAPWVVPFFVPGHDVPVALTVTLARWMFPIVALLGLTGVVIGILQSYGRFAVPAFAPVAWNAVLIASLLAVAAASGSPRKGTEIYALGMLLATGVQLVVLIPSLRTVRRQAKARFGLGFTLRDPHVRRILRLMVPVSLGLGLININLTIDLAVASVVSSQGPAQLNFAFRLFMLPQGLFSVAIATVLFPEMARLAAVGDLPSFGRRVNNGLRAVTFLLLPTAALMVVLAIPVTRLVYQRGEFTSADTRAVASVLIAFSVGLAANGACLLLTRAFFSLQLAAIPTWIAAANLALNTGLDFALAPVAGVVGIAAATSVVTLANAVALGFLMHRRVGYLGVRDLCQHLGRVAIAASICAGTAVVAYVVIEQIAPPSQVASAMALFLALLAAAVAYLMTGIALELDEVGMVTRLARQGTSRLLRRSTT